MNYVIRTFRPVTPSQPLPPHPYAQQGSKYHAMVRRQETDTCSLASIPANGTTCVPKARSCDVTCLTRTVLKDACILPVPAICAGVWQCPEPGDLGAQTPGSQADACLQTLDNYIDCCDGQTVSQAPLASLVAATQAAEGPVATEAPAAADVTTEDAAAVPTMIAEAPGADASLAAVYEAATLLPTPAPVDAAPFTTMTDAIPAAATDYADVIKEPGQQTTAVSTANPGSVTSTQLSLAVDTVTPSTTAPITPQTSVGPQAGGGGVSPQTTKPVSTPILTPKTTSSSSSISRPPNQVTPTVSTSIRQVVVTGANGPSTSTQAVVVTPGSNAGTTNTIGNVASSGARRGASLGAAKGRLAIGMMAMLLVAASNA